MSQAPRGPEQLLVGLGLSLLDAKLSIPPPRPGTVSRSSLIEEARASGSRVVGVTAPAGYGKSTLLAEWASVEDRPVAWVSLDGLDDDPAALLTLVASAYERISPTGSSLVADMRGLGVSVLGRAAPRLASTFLASPNPFVVMMDDLHELRSPECHDVLSVLIPGIPRGSQLVTASRSEQPHVPQLRASGDVVEFGAGDLTLDAAGAQQIFSEAEVELAPDTAASMIDRTEGWPVGLYLASLIAKESPDGATVVTGDDRYVADYLYRESFVRLPEDDQRFLRRTAVLDQLTGPLCDAILEGSGGQAALRRLEATSLFVFALDRRREWYRYHALYREFLLGELRRTEPDVIIKLHLRAADWYESNGSPSLAIEHLLNTTERDRCVQLVTALILPTYSAGQLSTAQRWLSALDASSIQDYPPLAVLAGWVTVLTGQTTEAQRWAAVVDGASFEQTPADGTASFESARAMLRAVMCAAGPERMMADAGFAIGEEPPWSPWRDTALALLAEAHLLAGDLDGAAPLFVESSALGADLGNTDTIVLPGSELALMAMDRGEWEEAAGHLDLALATCDEHRLHDYALSTLAFVGAARLALHRGVIDEANRQLARAMRARPSCTFVLPWIAVRLRVQLAKLYLAMGDASTSRHLVREIDDILLRTPSLGALIDEVSALRQTLASSAYQGAAEGPPLSPAELRLLPYLQTHLTSSEIAGRLFVSRNTVRSQVGSIYRKFGVSSRGDAVQHATEIGLLGG
jgi:LuxR family maltose regulon positive regulatory protein